MRSAVLSLLALALLVISVPSVGHAQITVDDFTADFESGNVHNVAADGVDSFTFEIRLDDSQGDLRGWFYFAIANNTGRTATLFLTNRDGWQDATNVPVCSTNNDQWQRVDQTWIAGDWLAFRQELTTDTVWFAQCMPYTFSDFSAFVDSMATDELCHLDTIGYSVHNRPMERLTVADSSLAGTPRKRVWLTSRQHPMESPPTFLLESLIATVTDSSTFARRFRRGIDLNVIGMANPDGVAEGYSRHNVNGINLNRDWQWTIANEQPEVQAIHSLIAAEVALGHAPDFFMDLHAAPDHADFGYRLAPGITTDAFFANQGSFLHLLESYDPWQAAELWRDLDSNYAPGVSCVILYDMYGLDCFSAENPWCRRNDESFITEETLRAQGPLWARAIYDYLCPLSLTDSVFAPLDTVSCGDPLNLCLVDYDQAFRDSLPVVVSSDATGDEEQVYLPRSDPDGKFSLAEALVVSCGSAAPGDGVITAAVGEKLFARYNDPDLPSRTFYAWVDLTARCGDVNGDGIGPDIADLVHLVIYMFQEGPPPVAISITDVDGNGDGPDIADLVYLVTYMFQNGPDLICP